MSVDEKREKVLESLYEEMLHKSNYHYDKDLAEVIKALEAARLAEKEFELKDAEVLTENANAVEARKLEDKIKLRELVVNTAVTLGQAALWATIFVLQMEATRKFEETGTETSAVSRWLKQSFPKMRLL